MKKLNTLIGTALCYVTLITSTMAASAQEKTATLPQNLVWYSGLDEPALGAPEATKGGRFTEFLLSYPLTFRTVGPDSNSGIRSSLLDNQMELVGLHPITDKVIPKLAKQWAYDDDGKTVYYRLNPLARWSDGHKVTADDFLFAIEFMRSKHIVAPWYNNHYTNEIVSVTKYDQHTIAVTGNSVKPRKELHYYYGLSPKPKHFHVLDKDWVRAFNWRVEPNTGPYQISRFKAGKFIEFNRKQDWWAKDLRYFKGRFNADTVRFQVIRDINVALKYFEKGYLDSFGLTLPDFWANKTKSDVFKRGLVNRIVFYTDTYQPQSAIYLNMDSPIFSDKNVRFGVAHSLNMNKVIHSVLHGDYARANALHVGFGDYSNKTITAREFDLDKANQYFEAAGWATRGPDGIRVKGNSRLSFTMMYGADHHTQRLIVLKEEAKKAGLEIVLRLLEPSSFYKNIMGKKHQAVWMAWVGGFRPQYWGAFHSDNAFKPQTNNITATSSPKLDVLIDAYKNGTNETDRIGLAQQIEQYIHDEGAVIPRTYVPFVREAYWRWLKLPSFKGVPDTGSLFAPFGETGGYFWIDETIKADTLKAKKGSQSFEPLLIVDEQYRQNK